jgi:serine/threonine-protein kinase HipA
VAKPALDVYLNGELAGALLRKDNGNLQFRYDRDYVEAKNPPLSLNLPLRTEAYPHRHCLAFFGNLLPEEDVRAQVALATGISAANDYRLLERFGGDVAGAITLLPSDQSDERPEPDSLELLSEARLDEVLTELPQRPLAVDEKGEVRMSLAGAQSKLPVVETGEGFALPHGSGHPTTHILKPEPARFPGLVTNEFFCMRLAKEVGLQVAEVGRAETTSGLPFLVVTRYDRDLTHDPIRRLHQEDICQALGKLYVEKYQHEGGPGVRDSMELIDRSAVPARDREQFWMALVFNVLIGNCDAHGKNYSLLYYSPAPSLAPLYDLLSTSVYGELTKRLAMSIDGAAELEDVEGDAWAQLAGEVGFAPRFQVQRMGPFVDRVRDVAENLSAEPEYADPLVAEIVSGIRRRSERFGSEGGASS